MRGLIYMSIASESSKVNLAFLKNDLGLNQVRNTTLFQKDEFFIISPSVQNKKNWFDVSESVMENFDPENQEGYLLIRFQDKFLMAKLQAFQKQMMINGSQASSKSKSPHWKFKVIEATSPYIVNMGDINLNYPIQMPSENQLKSFFNKES